MRKRNVSACNASGCRGGVRTFSRLCNAILIVALLTLTLPARSSWAQSPTPVYTFPECEQVEEELLLGELNRITRSVFDEGQGSLDIADIVDRNWVELGLDSVLDDVVDEAADEVLETEGLWDRIISGWHPPTAERFTQDVVTLAFDSPKFREAVSKLSQRVVDDLTVEIHVMTAISASTTLLCVQEFIGSTFSETMSVALERDVQKWLEGLVIDPDVETDVSDTLRDRTPSLVGIGLIVGAQISSLLAKKVAQQIGVRVLTRILGKAVTAPIPVAGWVIGGALIVWDLINIGDGSVPQIRDSLKEQDVKREIRAQISTVVEEELHKALPGLANSVTIDMYGQWKSFLQRYEHVLRLAEKNPRFRLILDGVTADQLVKLSELVATGNEVLGNEWLDRIIESGEFELILALPKTSFEILRETANPGLVLEWAELAEQKVVEVVETGLYKVASPPDLGDRDTLTEVLDLEDASAIKRLMQLETDSRTTLLRLQSVHTKWLLIELLDDELSWLSTYIDGLPLQSAEELVSFLMRDQELLSILYGSSDFQMKFPGALAFASSSPRFQTMLDGSTAEQAVKLSNLVVIAGEALGFEELTTLVDTGQFEEILALPSTVFVILEEEKDPAKVISWASIADEAVVLVVKTGLFRFAEPSDFEKEESLSKVLALSNQEAIRKLMLLDLSERDVLTDLPTSQARGLLLALEADALVWLAGYVPELTERESVLLADYVLSQQGILSTLRNSKELQLNLPRVLTLAEDSPHFLSILIDTSVESVEKLSKLVAAADVALTQIEIDTALESGQFERLLSLPEITFLILEDSKDPATVLDWANLAGSEVGKVVETDLYRVSSPSEFSGREALNRVLALEEPEAIQKLMQLHQIERIVILGLSTDQSRAALMALSLKDLAWLALYLAELAAEQKDPLVNYILQDTEIIPFFKENEVVRTKFPRVLMLSLNHPRFEEFLAGLNVDNLEKLAELIAAADATMTPENLSVFLESDEIKRVFLLPQKAFEILRFSGNPTELIDWDELAGERIDQVVDTGLYLIASPEDFAVPEELERVLEIEHVVAIQRLMAMDRKERESLLQLPAEEARSALLSDLSDDDLSWLASYLPDLSPSARTVFASNITQLPELVPVLRASEEQEQEFKRVLELAAILPPLRTILDNANPNEIAELSDLVVIAEDNLAPDSLPKFFASGQFASILSLPREAFKILEWSGNPAVVIEWAQLAGDAIVEVAETELYKEADPGHFRKREELDKALALVGSETLTWLVLLEPKTRESVFSLDADPEITWLHDYSIDLIEENIVLVAHSIDQKPAMLSELDKEIVGQSVKRSQNFEQALAFVSARIAEPQAWWPTAPMLSGAIDLSSGNQPWQLYWHYHQTQSIILLGALFLLVALALSVVWLHRRQRLPKIRDYLSRLLGGQA